ncbi:YbaN family protein [Aureimonas sp. D3]|uniref:YbaN family protein n=1 Tax=Aureimonas sp. D3 TaxID=1638164 RepID=UPI000AFB32D9|nr:YbaN family protein [Aureimonas sp. D3]
MLAEKTIPHHNPAPALAMPADEAVCANAATHTSTHVIGRAAQMAYRTLGFVCLGLAIAGVVLPGLPATPFALLSVWAFGRGSPEWAARVERDPRFGPTLRNWRERRAVPVKAKCLAVGSMALSYGLLFVSGSPALALWTVGLILVCVASYLVTRPSA